MKTALITGATSGIGMATAKLLAKYKYKLIICGRRKDRLENLAFELSAFTDVHFESFDVSDKTQVFKAVESLPDIFKDIDILLNNAGNAHGLDPVQTGNLDDWDRMMDINVKGLLYVTKAILPGMIERNSGHIINIGSIAGKEVYTNGNVYCASKHAVDALSAGMRLDLNPYNIKVSEINPGLVETEFSLVRFKGDTERAGKIYQGYKPLTPEDVAEIICFVVSRPAHVNISDLTVLPAAQASATVLRKE
jgi:3-hydroxy acid dehydrogenase / malonic semialdehyde reductase